MYSHNIAAVALSALTVVSATKSPWTINVNEVSINERSNWCTAQFNACDQLCSPASTNTCNVQTLEYDCTCNDGSDPKLSEYAGTIVSFTCNQAYSDCNLANVGDKQGQDNCTTSIQEKCGTKDPSKKESSGGSGGSASSSSAAPSPTSGNGGSSPASTQKPESSNEPEKSAGAPLTVVSYLGNGAAALAVAAFVYMI